MSLPKSTRLILGAENPSQCHEAGCADMSRKSMVLVATCSWSALSQSRLQFVSSAPHAKVDKIDAKFLHAVIESDAAHA